MKKYIMIIHLLVGLLLIGCAQSQNQQAVDHNGREHLSGSIQNEPVKQSFPTHTFVDDLVAKTNYQAPTGTWFMHNGEGLFGYGLTAGTVKAGADFNVSLFGHKDGGETLKRDIRIQLSEIHGDFDSLEVVVEETVYVETVEQEQRIYRGQIPHEENKAYLLSMEVLDRAGIVEDTMLSTIYVPKQEINVTLSLNQDAHKISNRELTYTIENHGPTFIILDLYYRLEQKVDGTWQNVPIEDVFEDIAYMLEPNGFMEFSLSIEELETGNYRLVKEVRADGIDLTESLRADFRID